jgi:2,3-bisphosphoglycerate-dependent phosphoglycerate mutase
MPLESGSGATAAIIVAVRHGETAENRDRIIQGHAPGHLTDAGRQQARALGRRLLRIGRFDRIVSSDLDRARDTAVLIAGEMPPCVLSTDARLRERGYGDLEGQPAFRLKRLLVENRTDLRGLEIPNAESYADFESRVDGFFRNLASDPSLRNTVLVSHAGVLRVLLEKCLGRAAWDPGNGEGFRMLLHGHSRFEVHPL